MATMRINNMDTWLAKLFKASLINFDERVKKNYKSAMALVVRYVAISVRLFLIRHRKLCRIVIGVGR